MLGRWTLAALILFLAIGILILANGCSPIASVEAVKSKPPARTQRPNIILINLDDADRECVEIDLQRKTAEPFFPNLKRLATEGVRFTNFHSAVPICNPSRVCLFTGQNAFQTGVRCNSPRNPSSLGTLGGFQPFRMSGPFGDNQRPHIENEIGAWMKGSGYRTMFVGKFLHDEFEAGPGEEFKQLVPKGWDDFYCSFGATYFSTMFYKNGEYSFCKTADSKKYPVKYRSEIERVDLLNLVNSQLEKKGKPFFLYYAPLAPHREETREFDLAETMDDMGMVDNRFQLFWPEAKQVRQADFDEADNSDKPSTVRQLARLQSESQDFRTNDYLSTDMDFRRRLLSLKNIDAALGDLFETLQQQGAANNTLIILTSDHGYSLGQLRHTGKCLPYDRITSVPTIAWGPGVIKAAPGDHDHLLSNIDFAPTFLDIAGTKIPSQIQGKSFWPVLNGSSTTKSVDWRPEGILVEHWEEVFAKPKPIIAAYAHLRLHNATFTQWYTGEEEFYDLTKDPLQLENAIQTLSAVQKADLRKKLQALRGAMPAPECFIAKPLLDNHVYHRVARIFGLADYKLPIREVRLQITRSGGKEYWNGEKWTAEPAEVTAQLDSTTTILTGWQYVFEPPEDEEVQDFQIVAQAVGSDGALQKRKLQKSFAIDQHQPICQITFPDLNNIAKLYKAIKIRGSANDDSGLKKIEITIQNSQRNKFWNGNEWQSDSVFLDATLTMRNKSYCEWSYDFKPSEDKGEAFVVMRATANDGKSDEFPPQGTRIRWGK
jgi:arylsulfatase A-like enzyme